MWHLVSDTITNKVMFKMDISQFVFLLCAITMNVGVWSKTKFIKMMRKNVVN